MRASEANATPERRSPDGDPPAGDAGPEHALDDRKAAVLRAIIEQYVASAQPVGSATVTRTADLGVSAATVRNEMSQLEREGYIAQPHTSAGRIPTDRGYRYYVDHLAGATTLGATERRRIAEFFTSATSAMDDLLFQTSQLLSNVTTHAAIVVGPQSEVVVVRGVQLVRLQPRLFLAVVVLSNGAIEKRAIEVEEDVADVDVEVAGARLAQLLDGHRLADIPHEADAVRDDTLSERLVRLTCDALAHHLGAHHADPLYVGGAARLAAETDAFSSATLARIIELLEQHVVLAALLREMLGPGLTVRIGSENERADLREVSVVLAPYLVEGEPVGTVGVLGPTRMDYRRAQAVVATVSQRLGRQLSP
jgi:heat-inducible transcriptional repressor